jgi:hypothetical protein
MSGAHAVDELSSGTVIAELRAGDPVRARLLPQFVPEGHIGCEGLSGPSGAVVVVRKS